MLETQSQSLLQLLKALPPSPDMSGISAAGGSAVHVNLSQLIANFSLLSVFKAKEEEAPAAVPTKEGGAQTDPAPRPPNPYTSLATQLRERLERFSGPEETSENDHSQSAFSVATEIDVWSLIEVL